MTISYQLLDIRTGQLGAVLGHILIEPNPGPVSN